MPPTSLILQQYMDHATLCIPSQLLVNFLNFLIFHCGIPKVKRLAAPFPVQVQVMVEWSFKLFQIRQLLLLVRLYESERRFSAYGICHS